MDDTWGASFCRAAEFAFGTTLQAVASTSDADGLLCVKPAASMTAPALFHTEVPNKLAPLSLWAQ